LTFGGGGSALRGTVGAEGGTVGGVTPGGGVPTVVQPTTSIVPIAATTRDNDAREFASGVIVPVFRRVEE